MASHKAWKWLMDWSTGQCFPSRTRTGRSRAARALAGTAGGRAAGHTEGLPGRPHGSAASPSRPVPSRCACLYTGMIRPSVSVWGMDAAKVGNLKHRKHRSQHQESMLSSAPKESTLQLTWCMSPPPPGLAQWTQKLLPGHRTTQLLALLEEVWSHVFNWRSLI